MKYNKIYIVVGPEIWSQSNGEVTHFVAGGSTGGTISGTSKYLKEKNSLIKSILADPQGSILGHHLRQLQGCSEGHVLPKKYLVEGKTS